MAFNCDNPTDLLLEDHNLKQLCAVMKRLFDIKTLSSDERRDLANLMYLALSDGIPYSDVKDN